RRGALLDDQPLQIMASDRGKAERLPNVDIRHQMPCKTFNQAVGIGLLETLILQGRLQGMQACFAPKRNRSDQAPKDDPIGCLILAPRCRPGEPPSPDQAAIDMDCTRPAKGDGAPGGAKCREGVTKGVQPKK